MGTSSSLVIQTLIYGFVFWFALYLLNRSTEKKLLYTGLGLGAYALVLAFHLFAQLSHSDPSLSIFLRLYWGFLILPAVFWSGSTLQLLPDQNAHKARADQIWQKIILPGGLLIPFLYFLPQFLWNPINQTPTLPGYFIHFFMSTLPLLTGLWAIQSEIRQWQHTRKEKRRSLGLILTAALFFALGSTVILLQIFFRPNIFPSPWALLAIGIDLEVLGVAIAYLDAFEQGETLWRDFLRSFAHSALVALLFGGQIAFAMAISTGVNLSMMILLITTISLAIFTQVFSDPIQASVDRLIFARFPRLRQERTELRGVAAALPRTHPNPSPLSLEEAEFTQLTRRALSHFGNLSKLASNALIYLPIVEKRLNMRDIQPSTLERAAELKYLLAESIKRLKPSPDEAFGTTDSWRFYNAIYYPYVVGLRPYSHRAEVPSDKETQVILTWFRSSVPERTLHNWQNAAAALIAKDLREQ